jgi:hypothetical protein
LKAIWEMLEENQRLADLYCTGCNYCKPCEQGVEIAENFRHILGRPLVPGEEDAIARRVLHSLGIVTADLLELRSIATVAELIVASALRRSGRTSTGT